MRNRVIIILAVLAAGAACAGVPSGLFPERIGEARLARVCEGDEAIRLFARDAALSAFLSEFKPRAIRGGVYDYGGITIHLGIARLSSCDDAYGVYSGLTAMPRERWPSAAGEISYRPPYAAGQAGEYAFWFTSPTNPQTYASFYRTHGEAILAALAGRTSKEPCSYHWKILPEENRYADSIVYIKSREENGVRIYHAYAATYQAKRNLARIYVMRYNSEIDAIDRYSREKARVASSGASPADFMPMPGTPMQSFLWAAESGLQVFCQYRWICLYLHNMPDRTYAASFVRAAFKNMSLIRDEALSQATREKR